MGKHMTITNMTSRHDDMIIHVMVPVLSVGTHRGMLEKFLLPFLPFLLFSYFNYRWQGSSFSRQLKGLGARWGRGGKTKDTVTEEKASYLVPVACSEMVADITYFIMQSPVETL
jgi:uncharacterized membrane protein YqaE (UPF0057 family)